MRKDRIVVLVLALLCAAPIAADSRGLGAHPAQLSPLGSVAGAGILETLACAGCLGSGMALMTMGWGSLYMAALGAADGYLAGACADACLAAL